MKRITFYEWPVEVDVERTRSSYMTMHEADSRCCDACVSFRDALSGGRVPAAVTDFLMRAGAEPAKVQEVWGVPEVGFLNGWWIVVGRLLDGEWLGGVQHAFVEPAEGFKCWMTGTPSIRPPAALDGLPLVQLEFEWRYH